MTMLLTEKTKQKKIINEVQKKRNLFGLGLTSLIAACGATENAAENGAVEVNHGTIPTEGLTATKLTATTTLDDGNKFKVTSPDTPVVTGRAASKGDLQITIPANTDQAPTPVENNFQMTFRNGDHSAERFADGVKASAYKGLTADASQYDLVVFSKYFGDVAGNKTGAIYILWDIGAGGKFGDVTSSITDETVPKHLKVVGSGSVDLGTYYATVFYKDLGGDADQADLTFQSSSNQYSIIWDVTKYADVAELGGTLLDITPGTPDASPGILHIKTYGELALSDIIKINNNEGYDMIVKAVDIATYILWDVAKYYDADAPVVTPVVDLSVGSTLTAIHGALTITGEVSKEISIKKATTGPDEGGFTDIDKGGTNDIAFSYNNNTYILFGEKVANIDEESGTAISHTVDLSVVTGGTFYDKDATLQDEGFFDYDFDGDGGNPKVEKVGYRFIGTGANVTDLTAIKTAYKDATTPTEAQQGLSEEAYWDVA